LNDSAEQIAQCIARHAFAHPNRDAIIFLERGETETERLTYEELEARVASYAAGFERESFAGRAVAIAMPPGAAFVSLFLGCLRAGAIAVPVPLPDSDRSAQRIGAVLLDAQPAAVIATRSDISRLVAIAGAIPGAKLEILPQAAHLATVEQPERFHAAFDAFLGSAACGGQCDVP